MRYLALATDYDGTLAANGTAVDSTIQALEKLRDSGRRLILVTGRELNDLHTVFSKLELFDCVVAENGALLFDPRSKRSRVLAEPPPKELLSALEERGVPFSTGRAIVATNVPHEVAVLDAIRELGLEMQVIFNKGAVMVLPSGVNKCTGLEVALHSMELSHHNVVGVGDAENDHAFLADCECAVAVANALVTVKQRADYVTSQPRGAGVEELIAKLLENDLADVQLKPERSILPLGKPVGAKEEMVGIPTFGGSVLIAGPSQSGKSSVTTGLIERIAERGYQFCLIDPEGDYDEFPEAVRLGDPTRAPVVDEIMQVLAEPDQNLTVNLLGIPLPDRPLFFSGLLPRLLDLRVRTGRPHWIIVDEAHHLLPSAWTPAPATVPQSLYNLMLITVQPEVVAPAALASVEVVLAVGKEPEKIFEGLAKARKLQSPRVSDQKLEKGEVLAWFMKQGAPLRVKAIPSTIDLKRHVRKYAEGELPEDRSFYFRGPENKLNLRAYNLNLFSQLAQGVDDQTWMHHLKRRDYSRWLRDMIKDEKLAQEVERIEKSENSTKDSREKILEMINERYTAAA
jgi:hydroxymethylpyrimidine pyrophosphatase-like HAD family hydrolase